MKCTLKELAAELGLSPSTVSRALSGVGGISAATVRCVQSLARERGYVPDVQARSLRTGQGEGLIIISPFVCPTISALRTQALLVEGQRHFDKVQVVMAEGRGGLELAVNRALSYNPRAVIVSGIQQSLPASSQLELARRDVVLVALDSSLTGCDRIEIDRCSGAYQAARLLLLSGCSRPVFFAASGLSCPDVRVRGIMAAYRSLNRPEEEICLVPVQGGDQRAGYELMQELLKRSTLDGAFCYNDEMTQGALRALGEAGVRVPEDVRLVGFDDLPFAGYTWPSLTTVAQPVTDAAEAAIACCLARLDAPQAPAVCRLFKTRLVVRESAPVARHDLREAVFQEL